MASAVLPLLNTVPVLKGADNYDSWKWNMTNILMLLQADGSDCLAMDMCNNNVTTTQDTAEIVWRTQVNWMAIAAVSCRIAEGLISTVYTDICDLWVALENMYGTAGPAAIFAMYQQTLSFSITSQNNPSATITQLEQIYNWLESAGCVIPALVHAMTLLGSVPSQWNIASSFLAAKSSILDVTYQNVRATILTEFNQCCTSQVQANHLSGIKKGNNQKPQWNQYKPQQQSGNNNSDQAQKKTHCGKKKQTNNC